MKKCAYSAIAVLFGFILSATVWAEAKWEQKGDSYYLTKKTREFFSVSAAGANKFANKYVTYNKVDFLVRGENDWKDYGRLNLEGNTMFAVPVRSGMKVDAVHLLAGGNVGNRYDHDSLLKLYGDNYYYSVLTMLFAYQDGGYRMLSVPVFWDWFHLGSGEWNKDGAKMISLGKNPVRKDCSMYQVVFTNPRPDVPVKDLLLSDSWLSDRPSSEVFAVTLISKDTLDAMPRQDRKFSSPVMTADKEPADKRTEWRFDTDLEGWIAGCSETWDIDAVWKSEGFGRKGVVYIPACNWGGDKISWIEKKITLPDWNTVQMQFMRHSAAYSEQDKQWTDGSLKVIVRGPSGEDTVYEKVSSGEWKTEAVDLSRYKAQTVIIRFENHGAGTVRLSQTTSAACDQEDAVIDDIRIVKER